MSNTEQFIGPFTAFLVRALDLIFSLINNQGYYGASCVLYNLIPFLDPDIKKNQRVKEFQECHKGLLLEASMIGGMNRGHVSRNRLQTLNQHAYIVITDYLPIVVNTLHQAGYWSFEKGWGIIPASTLEKKKETPLEKPFPERLPEDLK